MRRAAGRTRVNVGINDVGRHNRIEALLRNQGAENGHIPGANFRLSARVARRLFMRIGGYRAVAWEMLPGRLHARFMHTVNKAARDGQRLLRILMIRALANGGADVADVEHRCKADINVHSDHFAGHQPAGLRRQPAALFHSQQCSKGLRGRQVGKALAKTLDAPAFLIDRDRQMIVRSFADLTHQLAQLRRIVIVAGEENQPANQRVRKDLPLFRIQFKTFDIQHYRTHTDLSYIMCLTDARPHQPGR